MTHFLIWLFCLYRGTHLQSERHPYCLLPFSFPLAYLYAPGITFAFDVVFFSDSAGSKTFKIRYALFYFFQKFLGKRVLCMFR